MRLTDLLSGAGFIFCILGVGGLDGYAVFGTGLIQSVAFIAVGTCCFYMYRKEGGRFDD